MGTLSDELRRRANDAARGAKHEPIAHRAAALFTAMHLAEEYEAKVEAENAALREKVDDARIEVNDQVNIASALRQASWREYQQHPPLDEEDAKAIGREAIACYRQLLGRNELDWAIPCEDASVAELKRRRAARDAPNKAGGLSEEQRTRQEIEKGQADCSGKALDRIQIELLLDIRDLLQGQREGN